MNIFLNIKFHSGRDLGAGVVALIDGKVYGGDSSFTYLGNYTTDDKETISGTISVSRHSPFLPSVLPGLDSYQLAFTGTVSNGSANLSAHVVGQEDLKLTITGTVIATI